MVAAALLVVGASPLAPPPAAAEAASPAAPSIATSLGAGRLSTTSVILSDFESAAPWAFVPANGGTGSFALDSTSSVDGSFSGRLEASVAKGTVEVVATVPQTDVEEIGFSLQSSDIDLVAVRLFDSTGQVHQQTVALDPTDPGWQTIRLTSLDAGVNHVSWAGAADGVWHGPITRVSFVIGRYGPLDGRTTGSLRIDDLRGYVADPAGGGTGLTDGSILFVGNSFTNGFDGPAFSYNGAAIMDANGSGAGGVPGIFKKLTDDAGLSVDVTIEAMNGQPLSWHQANRAAVIGGAWDAVVLQEQSTLPLPPDHGGQPDAYADSAGALRSLVAAANSDALTYLYGTWASPTAVSWQGYSAGVTGLGEMNADLDDAFDAVRDAEGFTGVVPVGDAFLRAVTDGLADGEPEDGIAPGTIALWNAQDLRHASAAGSYLSAAVMFATITQRDPGLLPTGTGSAAADLGIPPAVADGLHGIARSLVPGAVSPAAAVAESVASSATARAASAVAAAPTPAGDVSWSVSPADASGADDRLSIDLTLDPGETVTEHLEIHNLSADAVEFGIQAADGYLTDGGRFSMLAADEESVDAGVWIRVEEAVTVPAGGRVVVPFQVRVPDDASPGDHLAGIAASVMTSGTDGAGNAVAVDSRVGVRVTTRVTGSIRLGLDSAVDASFSSGWNPFTAGTVEVAYSVTNAGNTRLAVTPTVRVSGPFGAATREIAVDDIAEIAPGETRSGTVSVQGVWPLGILETRLAAAGRSEGPDGGVDAVRDASSITISAVPVVQALVLGVLLALLVRAGLARRRTSRQLDGRLAEAREQGRRDAAARIDDRSSSARDPADAAVRGPIMALQRRGGRSAKMPDAASAATRRPRAR